jgi:hypothetical protein
VKVRYEATTDADGQPDWLLHYTPGPKARAEYAAFMRQPGAEAAAALALPVDTKHEDLVATITHEPPAAPPPAAVASTLPSTAPAARDTVAPPASPAADGAPGEGPHGGATPDLQDAEPVRRHPDPHQAQAIALVEQFYQRFHGLATVTPQPKELAHATELLATHGAAKATFLLAFAHEAAQATHYMPQVFGGILHYTDRALAAYAAQTARTTQAPPRQATATERTQREQYLAWEHRQLEHLRAVLPPAELAARAAAAQARLVAAGTPAVALPLAVRVAVDQVLAAQAGLPAFEAWRQTQEVGG